MQTDDDPSSKKRGWKNREKLYLKDRLESYPVDYYWEWNDAKGRFTTVGYYDTGVVWSVWWHSEEPDDFTWYRISSAD